MFGIVLVSNVNPSDVFSNLIPNIGVLIAFYYGATGVACAWAYRKVAFQRVGFFFTGVLLPLVGGVVLLLVGVKVIRRRVERGVPRHHHHAARDPLLILARVTTKGDFFKPIATMRIGDIIPGRGSPSPIRPTPRSESELHRDRRRPQGGEGRRVPGRHHPRRRARADLAGRTVLVEQGAGLGSSISDEEFSKTGATLVGDPDEVWAEPDLIWG